MIKKTLKVLSILLVVLLSVSLFACKDGNKGTTDVTLKTPGNVISNSGAVVETENYFYFINGQEDGAADNDYGTPVKGSIMVTAKSDLSKSEIVVPKIVSSEDYNAGIYVFGDYVYYGTTTTKKGTDGQIAKDVLEFQKAKLDGSSVEEIADVNGLNTTFRFAKVGDVVYLIYAEAVTETDADGNETTVTSIYCVNTSNGDKTLVTDDATAYVLATNADASTVAVVYTETVAKYPDLEDNTETQDYNTVSVYKAGDAEAKKVLSGDRATTGYATSVTYTITSVANGYAFIKETSTLDTATYPENTYAIKLDALYACAPATQKDLVKERLLNIDHITDALFVSLDEVYYIDADGDLVKASLKAPATEYVQLATITSTKLLGVKNGYLYYLNTDSKIASVKLNDAEPETEIVLTDVVNTSWYSTVILGDYVFWSDSSSSGKQYINALNIASLNYDKTSDDCSFDVVTEDDVDTYTLKDGKILTLGKMLDADVAYKFDALVEDFKANAYDGNQRVNVRDEQGNLVKDVNGKVTSEAFESLKAYYDAMTDAQKELISEDSSYAYDLYIECYDLNNVLVKLDGFIEAKKAGLDETEKAAWKAKADEVKAYIDAKMTESDYEAIFNMADNNLSREYWGNSTVDGAYDYFYVTDAE